MTMRSSFLAVPVIGLLLAFLSPFELAKPGIKKKKRGAAAATAAVAGPWSRITDRQQEEAIAYAKEATGADFMEPPSFKLSRSEDAVPFLVADFGKAFKTLGAENEEQATAMAKALASGMLAAYDPTANVVHVLSENAARAATAAGDESLPTTDVLRLLLVRMSVLAMDRQLFTEWKEAIDAATTADAVNAAGAVLQGHAQHITKRVADHWQVSEAFDSLVTLLTAQMPGTESAPFADQAKFALLKGHTFMAYASKRRRVAKVLKEPPTDAASILDPAAYFQRGRKGGGGAIPTKVVAEFEALLPTAGGWARADEKLDAAAAEALLEGIDKQLYSAIMASFRSGQGWASTNEASECRRRLALFEFRGAGMAEQYVNTVKAALKTQGATVEDGAGRDSGLPGFAGSFKDEAGEAQMQATNEGKFVLVYFAQNDKNADREKQDDALEAAAEILAKAQKTRKNRRDK